MSLRCGQKLAYNLAFERAAPLNFALTVFASAKPAWKPNYLQIVATATRAICKIEICVA